jgi:hypothetical protein
MPPARKVKGQAKKEKEQIKGKTKNRGRGG